jgi:tetratricopeptide (TPR) repeat protein
MALNFSALGSPDEAERHFQDAIRVSGGPPQLRADARIDYGAFLFRQARIAEALPLLKAAVAIAPGSARAHQELGRILLHLGKTEPAAATLEKAVELDAQSPQIRLLLGRAYLESGRSEEGEKQLRLGREGWDKSQGSSSVK